MKLKDWADSVGVKYLTAYRWFKAGTLPVKAIQVGRGSILVEENNDQDYKFQIMKEEANNEAMTHFIKKMVEYSNSKGSVEDFAAYILSNYKLEMKENSVERIDDLKNKPSPEMTSNHFKKFLPKSQKPQPNMALMDQAVLEQITAGDLDPALLEKLKKANIVEQPVNAALMFTPEVSLMASEMQSQLVAPVVNNSGYNQGIFSRADLQTGSVVNSTSNSTLDASNATIFTNAAKIEISHLDSDKSIPVINLCSSGPQNPISNQDLENWRQTFEEASKDKDFKIFVHNGVNLNHTIIKYDQAKELTDQMVKAQLLKTNDVIVIDQQAKEICKWTQDEFDYMSQIVNEILNKAVAKNNKKSRKKETK